MQAFLEEVTRIFPKIVQNRLWTTYICYGIFTGDNTSIMERVYTVYVVYLAMILIWWLGDFSSVCQI